MTLTIDHKLIIRIEPQIDYIYTKLSYRIFTLFIFLYFQGET